MSLLFLLYQLRIFSHDKESSNYAKVLEQTALQIPFDFSERSSLKRCKKSSRIIKSSMLGTIKLSIESGANRDGYRTTPKEIKDFAPKGKSFSYDTIWAVTKMHYLESKRRVDIQKALPFSISTGTISNLYKEGLAYFRACHEEALPNLKKHYRKDDSPFILQVDGTNEGGKTTLFQVRHSQTGHILYCQKIPTENESDIVTIFNTVEERFGRPDAIISDMGSGILAAVKTQWSDTVRHYLCQFHFLRDLGKDILTVQYEKLHKTIGPKKVNRGLRFLSKTFVKHKQQCSDTVNSKNYQQGIDMIDWVLDFRSELKGQGFPFDLAWKAYYVRVVQLSKQIDLILKSKQVLKGKASKILRQIQSHLHKVTHNSQANRAYNQLQKDCELFAQIRETFHIMQATNSPLSQDASATEINQDNEALGHALENNLQSLQDYLQESNLLTHKKRYQKAIDQIKKYQKLLANEMLYKGKLIPLPRTNNLCETTFRDHKRNARRTTGKKNLSRCMDQSPAEIMLLQNLKSPDYIDIVFNDLEIHQAFAKIPQEKLQKILYEMKLSSQGQKKNVLIRSEKFLELNKSFFLEMAS